MKIIILAIGKEKDFGAQDVVAEYTSRISRYFTCEWKYIPSTNTETDNAKLIQLLQKDTAGSCIIALDEIGTELDSPMFAGRIQSCMNESVRTLYFVIGGSYGLSDGVRGCAHLTLALSRLTFPHQLVRLILAEQLYRACTIVRGEKYHH
jgi:23S rRNA (pseudouridine1915-N3)-methyltransferase